MPGVAGPAADPQRGHMTAIVPQPFTPTPERPFPGGAFTATKAELEAMHAADAAMRLANLARHVIDSHPETPAGRAARRHFLDELEKKHGPQTRRAVEAAARERWEATRRSRPPAEVSSF